MDINDLKKAIAALGKDGWEAINELGAKEVQERKEYLFNILVKGNSKINYKELNAKLETAPARRMVLPFNYNGYAYTITIQNRPIVDEKDIEREGSNGNGE